MGAREILESAKSLEEGALADIRAQIAELLALSNESSLSPIVKRDLNICMWRLIRQAENIKSEISWIRAILKYEQI